MATKTINCLGCGGSGWKYGRGYAAVCKSCKGTGQQEPGEAARRIAAIWKSTDA